MNCMDLKKKAKIAQFARDFLITVLILLASTLITYFLSRVNDDNNPFAISLSILTVAVIARFTNGYFFGVSSSVVGVLLVNTFFSEPFGEFSLMEPSYPLTFAAMLVVSIIICTQTTQIKKQQALRIEAEREKTRANLLRAISHDIRTPLTSIMGASSTLLESGELSADERDELVSQMHDDAQWLVRVTENLLTVTKFSAEGASLRKEEEVVDEILSGAMVKFSRKYPDMPVKIQQPDDILLVPMDGVLIEQVVLNLMENAAIHARGATQIRVDVAEEKQGVQVVVRDDGAGIDPALLPHVLDGYGHSSDTDGHGRHNMGIGLSVCRTIIKAHGGRIWAENLETGGAAFGFTLPVNAENGR